MNVKKEELKQSFSVEIKDKHLYLVMKRMVDIIGSIIGLTLLSPFFLVIAILIKCADPKGPVFFKQKRIGKDGKSFDMYKFRSMVSNAEDLLEELLDLNEAEGKMFKIEHDPRITRIGRIIRKTSIDELPQLWNVIKGDMTLVGPRPPLPREVIDYTAYDKQRLLVTPGCTGLWQVSGRNRLTFDQMVQLDLKYIRERNLLLDLKIIVKTFKVMIKCRDGF